VCENNACSLSNFCNVDSETSQEFWRVRPTLAFTWRLQQWLPSYHTNAYQSQYVKKVCTDLEQGCTAFCYCRPHYFYLYEVRPPMSSSYIYEIRLIKIGYCQVSTEPTHCVATLLLRKSTRHWIHKKNTRLQKQTYTQWKCPENALQCQPYTILQLIVNQSKENGR